MKLFSTSGIRRLVSSLPPEFVSKVGLAISNALCKADGSDVFVARDARTSGPMLESAITAGLVAGGCNVIKMGILPTPALAFHTHKLQAPIGIMLTASHNPPEYNGIKVFDTTSMGISPTDEGKIEEKFVKKNITQVDWTRFGQIKEEHGSELYYKMLLDAGSNIDAEKFNSVITDPGGGAGCKIISAAYQEVGLDIIAINSIFDPYFRARPSEPEAKNLEGLLSLVKNVSQKGATIGLAYDGDADRCVAIDEQGRFVPLDVLISLYSSYIVEQNGSKGIVVTHVDASMLIDKLVSNAGGVVKRTKVGDVAIGNLVASEKAIFGGEPCGAWIHPQYHLCPDGPLTGIKILEWVSERGPLSKLVDEVQDYTVLREKIPCRNELKIKVLKSLDEKLSAKDNYKQILKMDGLRISFEDDSWVLIRPSGTEPIIRVTSQAMTEKETKDRLKYYLNMVNEEITKASK